MPTLVEAIQVLFPNAVFALNGPNSVIVVSESGSEKVTLWGVALGPQPTQAELDAVTQVQVDAAKDVRESIVAPELHAIRQSADNAIADLDTYLAIASPTNAQVAAIVRKLCQQNRQIIKRLIQVE